ncbi:MAG: DUF3393 domain-containing protein [Gammaproteobacteria bacterium]|nr:MAG: DUF3393 domain-containing protein [Gammaproteobacteria bacterium]
MLNRRNFLSFLSLSVMSACSISDINDTIDTADDIRHGKIPKNISKKLPKTGISELDKLFHEKISNIFKKASEKWGDKKAPKPREYVKYTDKYQTRAIVNFDTGIIKVQSIKTQKPLETLKKAIINTLLAPDDPHEVDILSDKQIIIGKQPFLYNLVLDMDQKPIRWGWRAGNYADYLLQNNYQTATVKNKKIYFVTFKMVKNQQKNQQQKYYNQVIKQSKRFNVDQAIIYAIIETESSFNPYAMSHIPAYGLMQIVPKTAGVDAYRLLYKKDGIPSKNYLLNADNNIEMGTAYLSILYDRYLAKIKNKKSQEYCVIAAYNTGAGNVLRSFSKSRNTAFNKINQLNSNQVYQYLQKNLQHAEARKYLVKVTTKKQKYI